jgi:hypothetical protein
MEASQVPTRRSDLGSLHPMRTTRRMERSEVRHLHDRNCRIHEGPPVPRGRQAGYTKTPPSSAEAGFSGSSIGAPGFEPGTSCSRSRRANRAALRPVLHRSRFLDHAP